MIFNTTEEYWGETPYVRELLDPEGNTVTVRMWAPRHYSDRPDVIISAFQLILPGREKADICVVAGVDYFQSVIMTLHGIQLFLDRDAPNSTFDAMVPLCHGFPEFTPAGLRSQ